MIQHNLDTRDCHHRVRKEVCLRIIQEYSGSKHACFTAVNTNTLYCCTAKYAHDIVVHRWTPVMIVTSFNIMVRSLFAGYIVYHTIDLLRVL